MPVIAVLYFFGWVFAVIAGAMTIPLAYSLATGESGTVSAAFFASTVALIFLSGAIMTGLRGRKAGRNRRAGLLMVSTVWIVVPLAAMVPFYLSGHFADLGSAYFEAVSGFTTTGATVLGDLSGIPGSIILWRAELQWLGGLATYFALALLLGSLTGPSRFDWELKLIGGSKLNFSDQVVESFQTIMPIYLGLTVVCFFALFFTGIASFDAACLAMSAVSTGGFMPRGGEFILYGTPAAELVLAMFMFLGAVSLIWIRGILRLQWASVKAAAEPFWILAAILWVGVFLLIAKLHSLPAAPAVKTVMHEMTTAIATSASLISTSGFIISKSDFALFPYIALLLFCFVGGGRFSTAGGLKFFRAAAMFRQSGREFKILIFPHGVRPNRFGREEEDVELMKGIWATFAVIVTASWMLGLFLSANMTGGGEGGPAALPLDGAFIAAVSAISNIGPVYDIAIQSAKEPMPEFSEFTALAKIAYAAGMILGRVEILALLSLLNVNYWRT